MKVVEKVVTYITSSDELLVFVHANDKDPVNQAGLQVPAGTIEAGELPEVAAQREAFEETGLHDLKLQTFLGSCYYDIRPYADTLHRRHFFWLTYHGEPIDRWTHIENSGGSPEHAFELYWLPISRCHILGAGQGSMLGVLNEKI